MESLEIKYKELLNAKKQYFKLLKEMEQEVQKHIDFEIYITELEEYGIAIMKEYKTSSKHGNASGELLHEIIKKIDQLGKITVEDFHPYI